MVHGIHWRHAQVAQGVFVPDVMAMVTFLPRRLVCLILPSEWLQFMTSLRLMSQSKDRASRSVDMTSSSAS